MALVPPLPWVALSDTADQPPGAEAAAPAAGLMVFELALPLPAAAVLLDHRLGHGATEWSFSLFADLAGGIALRHRAGRRIARHVLAGPLALPATGILRLAWVWEATGAWRIEADLPAEGQRLALAAGRGASAPPAGALAALARGAGLRHPAVLWFGARGGTALPPPSAWIGPQTPLATARGPVPAGALRPGDRLVTAEGTVRIEEVSQRHHPAQGTRAPVLLRAPFFGRHCDLLVSADTAVALSGAMVEYLLDLPEIAVPARLLVESRAALRDPRRAVAEGVTLTLERAAAVLADGCRLALPGPGEPAARRLASAYEAAPLATQIGRGVMARAA
jgi:hypothetical protein